MTSPAEQGRTVPNESGGELAGIFCSYRGLYGRCQKPADTVGFGQPYCYDHLNLQTALFQWNNRLKKQGLGVVGRAPRRRIR